MDSSGPAAVGRCGVFLHQRRKSDGRSPVRRGRRGQVGGGSAGRGITEPWDSQSQHAGPAAPLHPLPHGPLQLERVVDLRRDLRPCLLGTYQPRLDHV